MSRECVIDITYKCNSNCRYCQWSRHLPSQRHFPPDELKCPKELIEDSDITTIVISGGEPLLHPQLEKILGYYHSLPIENIILITNGLLMTPEKANKIVRFGVSKIVFSLDTLDHRKYRYLRGLPYSSFRSVLNNLIRLATDSSRDYKIAINVVLTKMNTSLGDIRQLLDFAERWGIDEVKFQPVYDDGFLSINAPELKLDKSDVPRLIAIRRLIVENSYRVVTNTPEFWLNLANLLLGAKLNPRDCPAIKHFSLLKQQKLLFCYWNQRYYIDINSRVEGLFQKVLDSFKNSVSKCRVWEWCFCIQPLNHVWSYIKSNK